jgi:hypothetical protein
MSASLSENARAAMTTLADDLRARRFDDLEREIDPRVLGDSADELVAASLVARKEGSKIFFRLTKDGYEHILASLHLVAAFCPKCSSVVELVEGEPNASGQCRTCFVTWSEDTTAKPFVPKY